MILSLLEATRRNHGFEHASIAVLLNKIGTNVRLVGRLLKEGMIGVDDPKLVQVIDDPQAVVEAIFNHYHSRRFEPSPSEREAELAL